MRTEEHTNKSRLQRVVSAGFSLRICGWPLTRSALATMALALTFAPQVAHASCSGNACSSFAVESKTYSSSDAAAKATLVNKDQSKKIHLKGCITVNGKCGSANGFDVTIEPGKRAPISKPIKPAEAQNFAVDVSSAEFLGQPAAAPAPPGEQAGLCPGPGRPIDPVLVKGMTCCCETTSEISNRITHYLVCGFPDACRGKCVTNVKACNTQYEEVVAAKPPPAPTRPPEIKLSVVNGESEPLLVTLWDVETNGVIADRTLWNDSPFPVTLNAKGGKGHLRWAVSTKPKPGAKYARCGEGDGSYATGEKVMLKASHDC